jgi:TolA-binding protein
MLKFKQFLILEEQDAAKSALIDQLNSLIAKRKELVANNATQEERNQLLQQIAAKKLEIDRFDSNAKTAKMTTAPATTPKSAVAGVDTEGPPAPLTPLTPEQRKQSAFDALQSGKLNEPTKEILTTPGNDDMVRSLEPETAGRQGLATDTLGKFSKSFYRL